MMNVFKVPQIQKDLGFSEEEAKYMSTLEVI